MTNETTLQVLEDGCVTSAAGFKAGGIHAGFRANPERLDMALIEADELCTAAGTFTSNVFCAAPVIVSREHLNGTGRAPRAPSSSIREMRMRPRGPSA